MLLPLIFATVATYANPPAGTISQLPPEILDRKAIEAKKRASQATGPTYATPRSAGCMDEMSASPAAGAMAAQKALDRAVGPARARAGLCLGIALGEMGRWDEARTAFVNARDAAAVSDSASRARLGAMAGNAALAAGSAGTALPILDTAFADAKAAGDPELSGTVALDRARALVALGQQAQAGQALADARAATPNSPQAWLLSATLSRRQNLLSDAQAQIERAAQLATDDPEVGLEAGVIAMLSGREEAARKSWRSVLALSPGSDAAATAKGYLAQLDAGAAAP